MTWRDQHFSTLIAMLIVAAAGCGSGGESSWPEEFGTTCPDGVALLDGSVLVISASPELLQNPSCVAAAGSDCGPITWSTFPVGLAAGEDVVPFRISLDGRQSNVFASDYQVSVLIEIPVTAFAAGARDLRGSGVNIEHIYSFTERRTAVSGTLRLDRFDYDNGTAALCGQMDAVFADGTRFVAAFSAVTRKIEN